MSERKIAGGKLVVIEGTDGAGKGTQLRSLAERIRQQRLGVFVDDYPHYKDERFGVPLGEFLHGKYGDLSALNPYVAAGMFAADRRVNVGPIRAAMDDGKVVVANRYTPSNLAHGAAKFPNRFGAEEYIQQMEVLEYGVYGLPRPDLVIVLDVNPYVAQANVDRKSARTYVEIGQRDIAEEDSEHQVSAAKWYLWLCEVRDNYVRVDCMDEDGHAQLPPEVIEERIWLTVQENIPELIEP